MDIRRCAIPTERTQIDHILFRPNMYIGSVNRITEKMWVFDELTKRMIHRNISYVPGLYKLFELILLNAVDKMESPNSMNSIHIEINQSSNLISICGNGQGIPITILVEENIYEATKIFGSPFSIYKDDEKNVAEYGAKLCNIFSKYFMVITGTRCKKVFAQAWHNNMKFAFEPMIRECTSVDFTRIIFSPDLGIFNMTELEDDIVALMSRRAYDVAACTGVSVALNGRPLTINNFKAYIDLHLNDGDEIVYEQNDRWQVACCKSNGSFQQVSFVNCIATTRGGRHVDRFVDDITEQVLITENMENIKKGFSMIGTKKQVFNNLLVFINCRIINPTFDSHANELMITSLEESIGWKYIMSEKFIKEVSQKRIIESLPSRAEVIHEDENITSDELQLIFIPAFIDAKKAGSAESMKCTIILVEDVSSKLAAMPGLNVVGNQYYGMYPLCTDLLNVRDDKLNQMNTNDAIGYLCKIIGLDYKKNYSTRNERETLRYGKIMILSNNDHAGYHFKGLVINFIHKFWPELLKYEMIETFVLPIVKAIKTNEILSFYSMPEFEKWKTDTPIHHSYKIKYYPDICSNSRAEVIKYFENMPRHRITFNYDGIIDDENIKMAFSINHIDKRKKWLTAHMNEMKQRKMIGLPDRNLYWKGTNQITYSEFIQTELVLFFIANHIRIIPSLIDGLTQLERKVMFTYFKYESSGKVDVPRILDSMYEMRRNTEHSVQNSIDNLSHQYFASNNINLLQRDGTEFIMATPFTRLIFYPDDEPVLSYKVKDGKEEGPQLYVPIIPMVLVNGAEAIGADWSTKIYNYNPREIIQNLRRMLAKEDPLPMHPWYKNMTGSIEYVADGLYKRSFKMKILPGDTNRIVLSEMPQGRWAKTYSRTVLMPLRDIKVISRIQELREPTSFGFVLDFYRDEFEKLQNEIGGFNRVFKPKWSITTNHMHCFDRFNCLKRFPTAVDILKEFFPIRLEYYSKRKEYWVGKLTAQVDRLSEEMRFLSEQVCVVENDDDMIDLIILNGYRPDPVKEWELTINKDAKELNKFDKYGYLLDMLIFLNMTEYKILLQERKDQRLSKLAILKIKSIETLWNDDLDRLIKKLDEIEGPEQESKVEKGSKNKTNGTMKKEIVSDLKPSSSKPTTKRSCRNLNLSDIDDRKSKKIHVVTISDSD